MGYNRSANALRFGDVRIKVENKTELAGGENAPRSAASEAFARHLTEHYDAYAKDFPVLAKLKEIAKISAMSRFLLSQGVQLDLNRLFSHTTARVATPSKTPGIHASSPGRVIYGGVDLRADVILLGKSKHRLDAFESLKSRSSLPDEFCRDEAAQQMREAAAAARPGTQAQTWITPRSGSINGDRASKIELRNCEAPYRAATSGDHYFDQSWANTERCIRRRYDSSSSGGEFGKGWWLLLPYRIEPICSSGKRTEVRLRGEHSSDVPSGLFLYCDTSSTTCILRRRLEKDGPAGMAYCSTKENNVNKQGVTFVFDEKVLVRGVKGGYSLEQRDQLFRFDEAGRLIEIWRQRSIVAKYVWSAGLLREIVVGKGRSYSLEFETAAEHPRIQTIKTSDGKKIEYQYDQSGMLSLCLAAGKVKAAYKYDRLQRLIEVRDHARRVVSRTAYDASGNVLDADARSSTLQDGAVLTRATHDGTLRNVTDQSGAIAQFNYNKNGGLAEVNASRGSAKLWSLKYDQDGRLVACVDGKGVGWGLSYEGQSLTKCVAPRVIPFDLMASFIGPQH